MRLLQTLLTALFGLLLLQSQPAKAVDPLYIEIVGAGANPIPIAVAPFAAEPLLPQELTSVVAADLARSGLFRLIDASAISPRPSEFEQVNVADWKNRGAEAMVIGRVNSLPGGRWEIQARLIDIAKESQILAFSYNIEPRQVRVTAHRIADVVFEKLTGVPGVFSTRIAYVTRQNKRFELLVADADGFNPRTVVTSREPIISPRWSPDGGKLAYVSFERKKPIVYVQTLSTGQRVAVAEFKGSNSAPAWSPDGTRLAVALTRDGSSQIYFVSANGSGTPERLMRTVPANDTEPAFSSDAKWLFFTSDRGGGPQVYRLPLSGGPAERMTFEGDYNVSPRPSPDGKSFVFIQRRAGAFRVVTQDIASRQVLPLTDGPNDESPSFAPNGQWVLYGKGLSGRGELAAVSADARVRQRLTFSAGDVREPAWGPISP